MEELQDYTLLSWQVNVQGQYQVDHIVGTKHGAEERTIPFLIHGGHIRLLVPPRAEDAVALATTITISGKADKEWTAVGCRELLAAGDPAAPLVPGKRGRCTRCADVGSKGKVVELPGAPDGGAGEDVQGGLEPLYRRPSFAYGAVCQEIFAGGAGWSREKQVSPSKVIKYCACNK